MSLIVKNLSRKFGSQIAVDSVSFSVNPGEIVGFLGPNGAGKSTTMKIISGYLPPSEGSVSVAGNDVAENPILVKRSIGYLPEHNPLYLDMYVHEFLQFSAKVYGISGRQVKQRVEEMVDLCGLIPEQNKKIEALSKGYRQRVGLAQALLHDPEVLILDEPTSGLDPNQIIEIRKVIKQISFNKTVLFSSHIMQEVEALCDRAIIINKGKIVADDQLSHLMKARGGVGVIVEFKQPVPIDSLRSLDGVTEVISLTDCRCKVMAGEGIDIRSSLFKFASDHQLSLLELKVEEHSVETIFKELTATSPDS